MNRNPNRAPLTRSTWIATLIAVGLLSWAGSASAGPGISVARGDGVCPAGQSPVEPMRARADVGRMCNSLGTWYIARLAGGGSMDGPGYGCKIRDYDDRDLGHTLCAPARPLRPAPDVYLPGPDVYRPGPDVYRPGPDVYRPSPRPVPRSPEAERLRSGQRIALRDARGRFLVAHPDGRIGISRVLRGVSDAFTLYADGAVRDGETVRLRSHRGGFVTGSRRGDVVARRGRSSRKARWRIESADGYRWLSCGDRVRLSTAKAGYLSARSDGRVGTVGGRPMAEETFTLVCL